MEHYPSKTLLTIVTSTYNCADYLSSTAESIKNQTYDNFQWIVIDGASSDGTLDEIIRFQSIIDFWISEKDDGIYSAWNKAVRHIKGDWVLFLGAGDTFINNEVLSKFIDYLLDKRPKAKLLYGDVLLYINDKLAYRNSKIQVGLYEDYRPVLPAHQGVFQHRDLFNTNDKAFDDSYKVVADSKFLLQSSVKSEGGFEYLKFEVAIMDVGGVSQSPKNSLRVMNEFFILEKDLGYQLPKIGKWKYFLKCHLKFILAKCFGDNNILQFTCFLRRCFRII
ncbi:MULTISPECIES: glycosyltransferase family 2 protein [unclassified Endozoicomonas]|uniref:glycosyltransferase family 2 protein n=1 Tax=unclassified Endozoicomonas TaxID=2644528 RepID=UPI003BB6A784